MVCEALEVMIFPDIFDDVPAKLYAAEFILPVLGLTLGFGCASIFKLPYSSRRTVAIEAGIQNVGTALAIVSLSYPFEVRFLTNKGHLSHPRSSAIINQVYRLN